MPCGIKRAVLFLLIAVFTASFGVAVFAEEYSDGDITYSYELNNDGTVTLISVSGVNARRGFSVPSEINGYTVSGIGKGFLDESLTLQDDLVSLFIPNTVTYIHPQFLEGVRLTSINMTRSKSLLQMEEGNAVYAYLFADDLGCIVSLSDMTVIVIPEHRSRTYIIPEGVEALGEYALYNCAPNTLVLPSTLSSISSETFKNTEFDGYIEVAEGNSCFYKKDGMLFTSEGERVFPPVYEPEPEPEAEQETDQPSQSVSENTVDITVDHGLVGKIGEVISSVPTPVWLIAFLIVIVFGLKEMVRKDGYLRPSRLFANPVSRMFFTFALMSGILCFIYIDDGHDIVAEFKSGEYAALVLLGFAVLFSVLFIISEPFCIGHLFYGLISIILKGVLFAIIFALVMNISMVGTAFLIFCGICSAVYAAKGAYILIHGLGLGKVQDAFTEVVTSVLDTEVAEDSGPQRFSFTAGGVTYTIVPEGGFSTKGTVYDDEGWVAGEAIYRGNGEWDITYKPS